MYMTAILDLKVRIVPNLKIRHSIELLMLKIVEFDISLIFVDWQLPELPYFIF